MFKVTVDQVGFLTESGVKKALKDGSIVVELLLSGTRDTPVFRKYKESTKTGKKIDIKNVLDYLESGKKENFQEFFKDKGLSYREVERGVNFVNENITGSGVDVSFDSFRQVFCINERKFLDRKIWPGREYDEGYYVEIPPKATVSVVTREWLRTNPDIGSLIQSKVSNVSWGLSHISTTIDPGWRGELLITFTNMRNEPYKLWHGAPLATVVFWRTPDVSDRVPDVTSTRNSDRMKEYGADAEAKCKERRYFAWFWISAIGLLYVLGLFIIGFFQFESKWGFLSWESQKLLLKNPYFVALTFLAIHLGVRPFVKGVDESVRIILSSVLGR